MGDWPVSQITDEGAWSAVTGYNPGDVVQYQGVNYLAVRLSVGQTPPGVVAPPNALRIISFPFAFNTLNLNTGIPVYTPAVGGVLYDAWAEVTTPFATGSWDIGQGLNNSVYGLMYNSNSWQDLTVARDSSGTGPPTVPRSNPSKRIATFLSTNPLLLWASADASKGGAAVGGTAGSAVLYLVVF